MAHVLDAFITTLDLDSKSFKKGAQDSEKDLTHLQKTTEETATHMKEQGAKAKEFYGELIMKASELFAILAGGKELKEFIAHTMEADLSTGRLAKNIGLTVEELGTWQGAATLAGGSADGFNQTVKSMAGMLVDIEKKLPRAERALRIFKAAGIEGIQLGKKSNVLEVMDQLADKMHSMDAMEAIRLGSRMGMDDGTIRLFRLGREEMAKLREEALALGVATQADSDAAAKMEESHQRLTLVTTSLGRIVMRMVVPALQWFTDKLVDLAKWAKEHPDTIKEVFVGIAAAIAVVGAVATYASVAMLGISWPLVAAAAAAAALGAGVMWLITKWKEWTAAGKETQTFMGRFFAFFEKAWYAVKNVVLPVLSAIWEYIKTSLGVWIDAFEMFFDMFAGNDSKVKEDWQNLLKDCDKTFNILMHILAYAFGGLTGLMVNLWNAAWDRMIDYAKTKGKEVLGELSNPISYVLTGKSTQENLGGLKEAHDQLLGLATFGMAGGGQASQSQSTTTTVTVGELNVHTQASDAQGVGGYLGEMFSKPLNLLHQANGGY
jgi:hypothetical protein